jgi:hypothetical protein
MLFLIDNNILINTLKQLIQKPMKKNPFANVFLLSIVSFTFLTAYAQQKSDTPSGTYNQVSLTAEQKRSLYLLLQKYNSSGYYISPNIPSNKLSTALQTCEVPSDEEILALVDATVSGKAKNCLLIGTQGIYVHNGWEGNTPGRYFISYDLLVDLPVTRKGAFEISIGSVCFDMSGSSVRKDYLITILEDIKRELGSESDKKDIE